MMIVFKPGKKVGRVTLFLLGFNGECERFKLKELTPNRFKCLIFCRKMAKLQPKFCLN